MTGAHLLGAYGVSAERVAAALAHVDRVEEARRAILRAKRQAKQARRRKAEKAARDMARAKAVYRARMDRRRKDPPRFVPRKWPRRLPQAPGWRVMLDRMQPGAWYALMDVVALMPEYRRGSVKAWLYHAGKEPLRLGLVERALNPEHDHSRPARRQAEPMFLFRRVGW